MEEKADAEMLSNELKIKAGFGKDGEKGFDGAITNLCMQTYLCNCDFRKRKIKGYRVWMGCGGLFICRAYTWI